MERLNDPHGWPAGPEELAGRRWPKGDGHLAERYGLEPRVSVNDDPGWNGIGKAEIIGGGHAIDEDPDLIPAGDSVDDRAGVGRVRLLEQAVETRTVIKSAADPAQAPGADESLECLVDGLTSGKIQKVDRRPHGALRSAPDAVENGIPGSGWFTPHVRNM